MSAIWGHIDFDKSECSVRSMDSEYKRKCKLDCITERHLANSLFGCGMQYVNEEDKYDEMPYIIDDGKTIITADCILDNRSELISILCPEEEGKPIPDGRIICLAYKKWGYELAKHFKGIFSIAIYNSQKAELFICVDQTASRCLYYYRDDRSCSFSTLITPIKEIRPELALNKLYLQDFLAVPGLVPSITATETPYKGLFLVDAGTYLVIRQNSCKEERYYFPGKIKVARNKKALKKQFVETYRKAVKSVVRSDKDISIFLSSGLDSSSICSLAATELEGQGRGIKSYTYTPYYKEGLNKHANIITDETRLVRLFAERYKNVEPSFEDNEGRDFTEYFDELLDILEVPFKSYGNLPVILKILNRAHENNSRIILNGQCGNTTVSYGKIEEALNHLFSKHRYISFVRYYNNYFKLIKASRKKYFIPTVKYYAGLNATNTAVKTDIKSGNQFVNQGLIDSFDISKRSSYLAFATQQLITEDTYIQKLYYTPSFTYIGASETKTGLYTGMVIRDATRSIDILDFCNSVPFEFFCADGVPRALIRYCMEDFVPYELRYPITQRGLQSADWMERLKAHSDEIYKRLDENVESVPESNSEYLNRDEMKRFVAERVPIDYENKDPYLFLFNAIVMNKFLNKNVTDMQE